MLRHESIRLEPHLPRLLLRLADEELQESLENAPRATISPPIRPEITSTHLLDASCGWLLSFRFFSSTPCSVSGGRPGWLLTAKDFLGASAGIDGMSSAR